MTRDEELNQAACEFDNHYRGGQDAILHAFVAGATFESKRSWMLAAALSKISKNKTDDCEIYTMGCDCDEVAREALKQWSGK